MAKRKRGFTNEKYDKWIKENRGIGDKANYKPWLTIQDVPSIGKVSRLLGIKTGRQHDFFSDNETNYFYIAEFSDLTIDIKEQFPLLPREETIIIAKELGINHPVDPFSKEPTVITSDFLITIKDKNNQKIISRTIKQCSDLQKRQIEKFEIERRYWEKRNVDWGIVTEREINKTFASNIELVYQFYDLSKIKGFEMYNSEQMKNLTNEFKASILGKSIIRNKSYEFAEKMLLEGGCGISIFKHLIITKQIGIDMLVPINVDREILVNDV
ncbi:heteromeric transposase endonuclease subunit TnsA [Clostridium botulinum]|uniref:Heteromeric transposase endonuclease subunit TnsA n=1 Tax=Clostridium botulinum TaxID=1491 RepID=A0A0M1LCY5_CLOBO|nr:heteromeric transposase endonuclease subunit TnsA [Clostridium botulinum]KAI3349979.1 heteromeric transposase endonuclease subunit TnsA [Clostridium botulinum]KOM86581.1 transposase [Clostridium botulinum]KOR55315.1 transposase [Clostridium botulinum]NFA41586.1 heteromeric transposase endonuclease subunit TnsA [Clostridium botulinum]NFR81379.1 heteromeric transposase endonuclease subunit TnsA [Clostridium botulinum]